MKMNFQSKAAFQMQLDLAGKKGFNKKEFKDVLRQYFDEVDHCAGRLSKPIGEHPQTILKYTPKSLAWFYRELACTKKYDYMLCQHDVACSILHPQRSGVLCNAMINSLLEKFEDLDRYTKK